MRLIDAEELSKKLSDLETLATNRFVDTPYNSPSRERYRAQMDARREMLEMIAEAPTITPESLVRHGRRILDSDDEYASHYHCDRCNTEIDLCNEAYSEPAPNYCPNCGAKMEMQI